MAERVLGGFLGDEDDRVEDAPEGEGRVAPEAFAAAVAADQARRDPEVAQATTEFLREQTDLLREQKEQLKEQRHLRLGHLRHQSREGRLRRAGQRIRIGMQVFVALIASVIAAGLLVMVIDAFRSQSVIVDAFDAPPALAARGLTGKVIAGDLLDELTRLQAATRSNAAKRHLANAWTNDIRVEVPETGISVGDIDRLLKARFGHDLHIGGDVVQTDSGGLALTVRGDGVLPKVFTGGAGDLNKLTVLAAEYVYGQSQPYLFAYYLLNAGRNAEVAPFSKAAFARAKPEDRPYLLNVWADALINLGGSPQEGLRLYREALKLKPDYWIAYSNIVNSTWVIGDEEGAWRVGQALRKAAGGRPGRAPELAYQNLDALTWNLQAWRAAEVADAAAVGGVGTALQSEGPAIADVDVRLHDPAEAEFQLQTTPAITSDPSIAAITHFVHGRIAAEAGDVQRAAAEMEAFGAAEADPAVFNNYPGYGCWIAPAEEAAGHPDKADAALKAGGRFVDCYRFRGDILDHRGDWAGAQAAYAAAVAIAPDLPAGYYSWGVALARHGDLAGAEAKLRAANARAPNWADPLKAWGDVLAREGRWNAALAKYNEALKLAPAWVELRRTRDAAARRG